MIQERKFTTFMHKLYPLTKVWIAIGLSAAVLVFGSYPLTAVLVALGLIVLATEKKWGFIKFYLWFSFVYAASMYIIYGLVNPVNVTPVYTVDLIKATFYKEGLELAGRYVNRILPIMCILMATFSTINMTDLGVSLRQAGMSYRTAHIFVTTFQLIPILIREENQIIDAQRSRGLNTEGNVLVRAKALIPIMVPVVANSIMKVQQQAISLLTKGFETPLPKTIYRPLTRKPVDRILTTPGILLTVVSVAVPIVRLFLK